MNNLGISLWVSIFMAISMSIGIAILHDSYIGFIGYIPWAFVLGANIQERSKYE